MDIDDTPEEAAFRAEARAWLDRNALPKGHPDDFSLGLWSGAYDEATYIARCRAWQHTLHAAGWAGITWPREHGGRGGKPIEQVIFNQEQSRYGVSTGAFMISIGMAGPTILRHGSPEQKARFLAPMIAADEIWCQLFSEPDAGSDLANLATRAERDGDEWVVNGQKVWTSSPDRARYGMLLARTDFGARKHAGISYFLLDMSTPGIEVRPLRQMTGEADFNEVFLENVRVPRDSIVGERGRGWQVSRSTLKHERALIGSPTFARRTFDGIVMMAQAIEIRGRRAIDDPVFRNRLVEIEGRLLAAEYNSLRLLTASARGEDPGLAALVPKLHSSTLAYDVARLAMDMMSDRGCLYPGEPNAPAMGLFGRAYMWYFGMAIGGGAPNIQRNVIGERGLGLPRDARR